MSSVTHNDQPFVAPQSPAPGLPAVKNKAMLLGKRETIVAITSEPRVLDPTRPICLVLNAGFIHRVGAHRNSVELAHRLAEAGFMVVRVDLSGVGDSPARDEALDFGASAVADIAEIADHLSSLHGVNRFVAIGLCSGADNAFQAARDDERFVGAAFIDGYAYPTRGFHLRRLAAKLRANGSLPQMSRYLASRLKRELRQTWPSLARLDHEAKATEDLVVPNYVRGFPCRDDVASDLQRLVERRFRMLWLFTGGVTRYFNYMGQMQDAFPEVDFGDTLDVVHLENANHTATAICSQQAVVETITGWALRSFSTHH